MANSQIDSDRNELHDYIKNYILPFAIVEINDALLHAKIRTALSAKFGLKYTFIIKRYENTIRISANKKSNGIIYYMAITANGVEHHDFNHESWPTTFLN